MKAYRMFIKPAFDFVVSFVLLLMCSWLLILIILLLLLSGHGNPFFLQTRPGRNGRLFRLIKFRTMNDTRDGRGLLLSDSERITFAGKIIRKTSLDELPQLINVIKGDMSIVGPRPLLPEYLSRYNETQKRRHEVRPGITGWAQINGRNSINWNKKFELDVWYVDHCSFSLDLKIIWLTFLKVVKPEGINQKQDTTMEPFTGAN